MLGAALIAALRAVREGVLRKHVNVRGYQRDTVYFSILEDEWPGVKARLEGKVAVHSIIYSRNLIAKDLFDPAQAAALPAVRHALVRANPVNGRKTFYIGSHAWFIEGLPYAESRRLLDELLALTTAPERVYRHVWKQWDLVMWDNRCVLHRGRPWDSARYPRIMRRTTVAGEGPTANPPLADPATLPTLERA